jgi:hypothetical protein
MASSRRTGTNENISTAGDGTRNYSSFAGWEAATDNDLVSATQSEILECYDDAASYGWPLNANGATTDSSYFRIIRPATGEGHDATPNNGFNIVAGGTVSVLQPREAYFSLQDMVITATQNHGNTRYGIYSNVNLPDVIGCIVYDCDNSGAGTLIGLGTNQNGVSFINCLSIRNESWGFNCINNNICYNCTAISNGAEGFHTSAGSPTWRNCLGDNNTTADFTTGGSQDYNAASDTSANGPNSRDSQTFTYVDSGNDDYQLASGDAGAKDYGTDLSGTFDDDLAGATWSGTWDIGCLQAAAAAAAGNPWYFYANQ